MNKNIILMAIAVFTIFGALNAQDLGPYAALKDPRITTLPAMKMLVVEVKGDPNVSAQQGFGLLFKIFFSIPGAKMAPPRGRWIGTLDTPKTEWVGLYALPLPDQVTSLPPGSSGAKIDIWQYGEVAEILHVGGYDKEPPTIEKLMKFIADKGYVVAGSHEEEYLKGPESGPKTDEYQTIIRYQIRKK